MDYTLVIMAAGIGSRYGGGVKQLEKVGPGSELIIDYSIHDAIAAGFNKVIFIIRKDIYDDFYEVIGERMEKRFTELGVKWAYAYQSLPEDAPEGRTKPMGTGQAVLSCKGLVDGPFTVINADDYYGREAYRKAFEFMQTCTDPGDYGMVSYIMKNTLSDNGGVTRGICSVDADGNLIGIDETKNIVKTAGGAETEGRALDVNSLVSMNFWMFPPEFMDVLDKGFGEFKAGMADPLKDEYLLPTIVDAELKAGRCTVKVLKTGDKWFGVTYHEDKASVVEAFKELYADKVYDIELYSDIK